MKAKSEDSYEKWLVELVSRHYETNQIQSEEYLKILYNSRKGRERVKELCEIYGVEPKLITKLKLNI